MRGPGFASARSCQFRSAYKCGKVRTSVATQWVSAAVTTELQCVQVTRFAAPLAYNYLHVIRMQEYLGSDRVRSPPAIALCASASDFLYPYLHSTYTLIILIADAGHCLCPGDGNSNARCPCIWDRLQHLVSSGGRGLLHAAVSFCPEPVPMHIMNSPFSALTVAKANFPSAHN